MSIFKPNLYYPSIFKINYDLLIKKGIKVLIFDVDNTTVGAKDNLPTDEIINLINKLKNSFQIFIASNNKEKRVKNIAKILGVHGFYSVMKPSKKIKKLLLHKCNVQMSEVAIIGDQIVTDIFMGNRLDMTTILVDPISDTDLKVTYFNRFLERRIMKRIKVKRGEYYE